MYTKICDECGQEFQTKYKNQRFCKNAHFRICEICGNAFEVKQLPSNTKTCSKKCAFKKSQQDGTLKAGRKKYKETMLQRYGVEHPLQSSEFLSKAKQTCFEHYGTVNPMQSEIVKKKSKETCLEKYGVTNASKDANTIEKIKNTFQARYGADNAMQIPEFRENHDNSVKQHYGVAHPLQSEEVKEKMRNTIYEHYGVDSNSVFSVPDIRAKAQRTLHNRYGFDVSNIGQTIYWHDSVQKTCQSKWNVNYPCEIPHVRKSANCIISSYNRHLADILERAEISYEFEKCVGNRSYDIYLPEYNTLVEINPTYTHNSYKNHWNTHGLPSTYHLEKTKLAEKHGYRCIHLFEWDDPSMLPDLISKKHRIYARKCDIVFLGKGVTADFENKYHIQKFCKGQTVRLGLSYEGELIQIMTFGKPRYNKNYEWELLRLCSKFGYQIVGGCERLFKEFVRYWSPDSIISYCDRSKFTGDVYARLGMKLKTWNSPSKIWSKNSEYIRDSLLRQRGYDQLFNTTYGKGKSNDELMLENGWLPVYDCGQAVYVYK